MSVLERKLCSENTPVRIICQNRYRRKLRLINSCGWLHFIQPAKTMSHCASRRWYQILWHHSLPSGLRAHNSPTHSSYRSWPIVTSRVSQRCKFDKGLTPWPCSLCRGIFWQLIPCALPLFNQALSSRGFSGESLWLFNIICRDLPPVSPHGEGLPDSEMKCYDARACPAAIWP